MKLNGRACRRLKQIAGNIVRYFKPVPADTVVSGPFERGVIAKKTVKFKKLYKGKNHCYLYRSKEKALGSGDEIIKMLECPICKFDLYEERIEQHYINCKSFPAKLSRFLNMIQRQIGKSFAIR